MKFSIRIFDDDKFLNGLKEKMSKVGGLVQSAKNSKPDRVQEHVNNLINYIVSSNELKDNEFEQINQLGIEFIQNQLPITCKAGFQLCNKLIDIHPTKNFRISLTKGLKIPLSSSKKQVRELAIETSQKMLVAFKCYKQFWENYSPNLLPSKQNTFPLRESLLTLFSFSVENSPEFACFNYAPNIAKNLPETNKEIRNLAMEIIASLYERDKTKTINILKEALPTNYGEYLTKLSGESTTKTIETFASIANEQQLTNEEIDEQTIREFNDPFPEIAPNKKEFKPDDLRKIMTRATEWEVRVSAVKQCVAFARGAKDKKKFSSNFVLLSSEFSDCLNDARSALSKPSCLALAAIAKSIGPSFDQNTGIISPLFGRLNHSARIIAFSSELAITSFVEFVWGRNISNLLTNSVKAASDRTRLVSAKCLEIALRKWPSNLTKDFRNILESIAKDKSEEVRSYIASIDFESIKGSARSTPSNAEKPKDQVPSLKKSSQAPVTPIALHQKNTSFIPTPLKSESSASQSILELPEEQEEPEKNEEHEEEEVNEFDRLLKDGSPDEIIGYMEEHKIDISAYLNALLEELTMEMNEEKLFESSQKTMKFLISNYTTEFATKLNDILFELPADDSVGMTYIKILAEQYGELRLVNGLANSRYLYSHKYNVLIAQRHSEDANLCAVVIKGIIKYRFIVPLKEEVKSIMKSIYSKDREAAEALVGIVDPDQRSEFIELVCNDIPPLKNAFVNETKTEIRNKLKEMVGTSKIDFELIEEALLTNDSNRLLIIAAIRQAPSYDVRFVHYLLECIKSNDQAVSGAAIRAFKARCEGNAGACYEIAKEIDSSREVLTLLHLAILKADAEEVNAAMEIAKDAINVALDTPSARFAALSVIAACCVKFKTAPSEITENLSPINQKMIQTIIDQINKNL